MGFFWLLSTVGGIGTIKDLLCEYGNNLILVREQIDQKILFSKLHSKLSLACSAACDGWKNVDYITESATFFTYWTCLPWITFTYCLFTVSRNSIISKKITEIHNICNDPVADEDRKGRHTNKDRERPSD